MDLVCLRVLNSAELGPNLTVPSYRIRPKRYHRLIKHSGSFSRDLSQDPFQNPFQNQTTSTQNLSWDLVSMPLQSMAFSNIPHLHFYDSFPVFLASNRLTSLGIRCRATVFEVKQKATSDIPTMGLSSESTGNPSRSIVADCSRRGTGSAPTLTLRNQAELGTAPHRVDALSTLLTIPTRPD